MGTPLTTEDRKQMQFDVLWNTMADNELLPFSGVSALNKQLTTDNKIVIKAINELLTKLKINDTTVTNFNANFNTLVGNYELETADWDNLKTIDTNVIKSIYKVYLDVVALNDKVLETYTAAEKTKLAGIAANANNYVHPANHPASIITQDATNRFVTDAEKTTWNAKASTTAATTSVSGLMSSIDKTKLDGIATGATNYVHPANHPASIITQDATNRFVTDAEKTSWNTKANGVHNHTLDDVTDVDVTNKTNGYALQYDSVAGKIKLQPLPEGTGSGATSMNGLSDVDVTTVAPVEGAVLKFTSGKWVPVVVSTDIDGGTF
jgi:hypothetical protein